MSSTFTSEWASFVGTTTSIRCTVPQQMDVAKDKKTAISLSIYTGFEHSPLAEAAPEGYLQGYCYGILFRTSTRTGAEPEQEVCISDLVECRNDTMQDLLRKVVRILVLKYKRPCYVQLASRSEHAEGMLSADQINLAKEVVKSIDANTDSAGRQHAAI